MATSKLTTSHIRTVAEIIFALIILYLLLRQEGCIKHTDVATDRGTADSTFYWKNKYDEMVASQKATAEQFSAQNTRIKEMLDSVARVYNTKANRIQEMIVAISHGQVDLKPVPGTTQVGTAPRKNDYCPPEIRWMRSTFADPHYLADVRLGDSAYMHLQTYDTMTALWKIVKEGGLFNRKQYLQFDISFADTSRVITGLTTYRRLVSPKQFAIGPEVRLLYLDKEIRPLAGIGLQRETNRWRLQLSAGKDFTRDINIKTNGWYGEARASYQLIKF